jgi:hypothetical protein
VPETENILWNIFPPKFTLNLVTFHKTNVRISDSSTVLRIRFTLIQGINL